MNNSTIFSKNSELLPPIDGIKSGKKYGKCKEFFKKYGYLILCMAIPALLMYLMYFSREIYPIGDGSVLVLDLNGQYVWFFEALRNFVRGDASLLYSFARAMGGEFLGIYAYYLASPLSFIVCLFPTDRMLEGLLTLFLIKTALCGGTFGYYMHRTTGGKNKFAILTFSIFYALCSYGIVQQHNTMWIDAMMWLPLITLGIEELIKHGKFKLYTAFMAITLFSNFYIGYMVCIYCFFYFFLYYIAHNENGRNNPNHEKAHFLKSLMRMGFFSAIAVGIAMIILISAYYSLSFGKSTFSNPNWEWYLRFDIMDLLYKFLPGSYDTVRPEGYPFIYCGILTLLLIPAYFLSPKYSMRQKICSGLFVFLFIASFSLSVTDLIWHGFQRPNWLNYRYSFMLCFYLCVLACRAMVAFESFPLRIVAGTGGLIALLCVIMQQYAPENEYVKPNDFTCIWFTIVMVFGYLAVLGIIRTAKYKEVACIALVAVTCIEVFLNGLWSMNALDEDVVYSGYSGYNNYLAQVRPIVGSIQESDKSFYRMEKTAFRKMNDNMALNIRGLSGSTSTLNQETIKFLNKLGYASQSHWSKYLGGTPVNDSLLGIKYIITEDHFDEYSSYYEIYKRAGTYAAYKNPYALSLAFPVSEQLLDFQLGYQEVLPQPEKVPDQDKEDSKESKIGPAIENLKHWINDLLGIQETVRNAEYVDPYYSPFVRMNEMISAMLGENVDIFVPVTITDTYPVGLPRPYYAENHTCYDLGHQSSASLSYSFDMPVDGELYFYLPTKFPREISVQLTNTNTGNTKNCGLFGNGDKNRILSLGLQEAGDSFSLRMALKGNDLYFATGEPCIYYIDWAAFEDAFGRLAENQYQINEFTEDSFHGTLVSEQDRQLVMTTLAFDPGWQITVNGSPVKPIKALGSVLAFYVDGTAGETNDIDLVYRPKTLVLGVWISSVSLVLFLLLIALEPLMKKAYFFRSVISIPKKKLKADTMSPHRSRKKSFTNKIR